MEETNKKIVKKSYRNLPKPDIIRLGNTFVDDFLFDDKKATNISINALRVIFNIVADLRNEQFRPQDNTYQLSLFENEFQTEDNTFAQMSIKNSLISPSRSVREIEKTMETLVEFKKGWHKHVNSEGRTIKTYGGLITSPSYSEKRGYTTFLVNSHWLKELIIIPEYNSTLYNLVYNINSNKHILFALWLVKIPEKGTVLTKEFINEKFDLNYTRAVDLCNGFLKPIRENLDKYSDRSFNYSVVKGKINIIPYFTKTIKDTALTNETQKKLTMRYRLAYIKRRHELTDEDFSVLKGIYETHLESRNTIETAYKEFIKNNRGMGKKSTEIKGKEFLLMLQKFIAKVYQSTQVGKMMPNAYPRIV